MGPGEKIVIFTTTVLVGWIGYHVIGAAAPIIVIGSYVVGTIANAMSH
jgi:hypothetical protein